MTRSRHNTSGRERPAATGRTHGQNLHTVPLASAIAAILAGAPAYGQQQQQASVGALEEVVVTAQKKSENLQDVPVSILALGTQKLEELHVQNLDDYVKYLPSVSYSRGQGQGGNGNPGSSHVYMRGVVSGANENHTGSQPSVGTYLDEQPVTTIDGTVDVHVYDIARVEVLEGPQGTLYGASSQAGTIRIITNKPDPSKFEAGYDLGANQVSHGGAGWTAEGFANLPLTPVAAIRLVGWVEHDGGFIDNVAGTNVNAGIINGVRTFNTWSGQTVPISGTKPPYVLPTPTTIGAGSISNAAYVKDNYNTVDTKGGRAAMRIALGDSWTVTPTVMGQSSNSEGFFGYDPVVGDLQVTHFGPENSQDNWLQTALTVEGKVANLDMVYAGAWMKRDTHSIADYSDYAFFYDNLTSYGASWIGNNGLPIMPQEIVVSKGYFQKFSHELRFSTPQQYPLKATFGAFVERQLHDIYEDYVMPGFGFTDPYGSRTGNPNGFADNLSIPSTPGNTIWLTDEQRIDRDQAAFAQLTWDITSQFSAQVGWRQFKSDNTVVGFYGYSKAFSGSGSGMSHCLAPFGYDQVRVRGTPCTDLDKRVAESGHVPRYNLTYKITPDAMVYATYSKGFRPGGINRTAASGVGPYVADFLTNKEVGWKTSWFNNHLRWNGAIFWEDWDDFQFSFLGVNSVTIIKNGGNARIKGIDTNIEWSSGTGFTLSAAMELLQSRLQQNYCGITDPNTGKTVTSSDCTYPGEDFTNPNTQPFTPLAPAGADMPIAPKFKANMVARYGFDLGGWDAHVQAAMVYQTLTAPALKTQDQQLIGMQPAYALIDLSGGIEKNGMSVRLLVNNVADRRAQLSRFEQCTVAVCQQPYIIPAQPRTVGLQFGQKF